MLLAALGLLIVALVGTVAVVVALARAGEVPAPDEHEQLGVGAPVVDRRDDGHGGGVL